MTNPVLYVNEILATKYDYLMKQYFKFFTYYPLLAIAFLF